MKFYIVVVKKPGISCGEITAHIGKLGVENVCSEYRARKLTVFYKFLQDSLAKFSEAHEKHFKVFSRFCIFIESDEVTWRIILY